MEIYNKTAFCIVLVEVQLRHDSVHNQHVANSEKRKILLGAAGRTEEEVLGNHHTKFGALVQKWTNPLISGLNSFRYTPAESNRPTSRRVQGAS